MGRRSATLRTLFAQKDFRRLCTAQAFGGLGEWLATLALIALVWDRTGSAFASGTVLALRILPAALIGSVLCAIVDRFDRRRVLIACLAARACIYGSLPLVGGVAPVLALALAAEVATLAFAAARDATLPRLVSADSLPAANAISMASAFVAMPFGSGIFAALAWGQRALGRPGQELALFAAAVMMAKATVLIGRIARSTAATELPRAASAATAEPAGTFRAVLRADPVLRRVVIGGCIAACCGGALITLGLAYVRETLQAGEAAYGALLTTFCAGAVTGIVALQRARRHLARLFHLGVGVMGAILLGMAIFPSQAVAYGMGFGFGAAFVATFLGGITMLQERVHDGLRGRVFAFAHSGLRLAAVSVGLVAAWGARRLGAGDVLWTLDGTQIVLGAVGAVLLAAGGSLLARRTAPQRA